MSGQNTSAAVMQRRIEPADSLDYFPTPPWATRAMIEFLQAKTDFRLPALSVWEPCCGEMFMVKPLQEAFGSVRASDVIRYTPDHEIIDFTVTGFTEPKVDMVFMNPPFRLGLEFIQTALAVAEHAVCAIVRGAFLEGDDRFVEIFDKMPPAYIVQHSERVVMLKHRLVRANAIDPFHRKPGTKASTATSYTWLVWLRDENGDWETDTRLRWIPKCRLRLERPGDYPDYSEETRFTRNLPEYD